MSALELIAIPSEHARVAARAVGRDRRVRSILDQVYRFLAAVLAALLLPLLLLLALLVLCSGSGGPFYRQRRIGLGGREFTMWKFRTMRPGAEHELHVLADRNERDGPTFKIRADPRVTAVGRVLRRTSLDELPQLWNIVRGDMTLVGPRPALPEEVVRYSDEDLRRLAVKPGLTGLWQVRGRSNLSWEDSLRLDVEYVEQWSIRLEAAVLLATPFAVLRATGAY